MQSPRLLPLNGKQIAALQAVSLRRWQLPCSISPKSPRVEVDSNTTRPLFQALQWSNFLNEAPSSAVFFNPYVCGSRIMTPRPVASASPRNLSEMQKLWPRHMPTKTESELFRDLQLICRHKFVRHTTGLHKFVALVHNEISTESESKCLETFIATLHYHEISILFYKCIILQRIQNLKELVLQCG